MRLFSWNVNGLRSVWNKGALQAFIAAEHPDVLCLQETKAKPGQAAIDLPDYTEIWNSAERPGYSGTAIFTKIPPHSVRTDFPNLPPTAANPAPTAKTCPANSDAPTADLNSPTNPTTASAPTAPANSASTFTDQFGNVLTEGRVLTAEFADFFLVNTYVPNSKPNLERLDFRARVWDPALLAYLQSLAQIKPIIVCGDFNVAHESIDLARPDANHHHAGFTDQERRGFSNLLAADFLDTFRLLHPTAQRYTWWSHWAHARTNNIGWRIDYFLASASLHPRLRSADIHESYLGSDHCPISLDLTP